MEDAIGYTFFYDGSVRSQTRVMIMNGESLHGNTGMIGRYGRSTCLAFRDMDISIFFSFLYGPFLLGLNLNESCMLKLLNNRSPPLL